MVCPITQGDHKNSGKPGDDVDDERVADKTEHERGQVYRQSDDSDDPLIVHTPSAASAPRRVALPRLVAGPRDIRRHLDHVIATYKSYTARRRSTRLDFATRRVYG